MKKVTKLIILAVIGVFLTVGLVTSPAQGSPYSGQVVTELQGQWIFVDRYCSGFTEPKDNFKDLELDFGYGSLWIAATYTGEQGGLFTTEYPASYTVQGSRLILASLQGSDIEDLGFVVTKTPGRGTRLVLESNPFDYEGASCEIGETLITILSKK